MGQKIGSYSSPLEEKTGAAFKVNDFQAAPAAADSAGEKGEVRIAADYIYVCTDTDTWVRAALVTWA